jgi:hypothetical protein
MDMIKRWSRVMAVVGAVVVAPAANAQVLDWTAMLNGAQEVPPVATPGTGTGMGTFNMATNLLTWTVTWQNLTAPAFAGHFHGPALPGAVAGIRVEIPGVTGVAGSTAGSAMLTDAQRTELLSGLWYINIHTRSDNPWHPGFPSGEIRGQVVVANVVPEPASYTLLASGLGLFGLIAWRRKAAV